MNDLLTLSCQVETGEGAFTRGEAERIFRACFPEPERGHWFWPKKVWQQWATVEWYFVRGLTTGDFVYSLGWIYRGKLPTMIHSNARSAVAHALRVEHERKIAQ